MKSYFQTKSRRRETLTGLAFAALPLTGLAVFFVAPFLISVYMTFRSGMGGARFVGFRNYISLLESEAFRLAVWNTARFMSLGIPLLMGLSLGLALLLMGDKSFIRTGLMFPMLIPSASVILFFRVLFERNGSVNHFLERWLALAPVNFLGSSYSLAVALLLYVWKNFGYNIILFMAGLSQIPNDYYEAAQIDGASKYSRFFYITAPLLAPTAFFVFIMAVIQAFRSFREVYALSGSMPHASLYMLQHFMITNFQNFNYQRLAAAALLTFMFIFALVGLLFVLLRKEGDHEL